MRPPFSHICVPFGVIGITLMVGACTQAPVARGPSSQSLAAELHPGPASKTPDHCVSAIETSQGYHSYSSLCPESLTPDLTASLQRALTARGLYNGPANGHYTDQTADAVTRYQTARGLPATPLSVRAAQQMGLIPWAE